MSIAKQDKHTPFFDATFLAHSLFGATDRFEIFRREVQPALEAIRDELCQLYCLDLYMVVRLMRSVGFGGCSTRGPKRRSRLTQGRCRLIHPAHWAPRLSGWVQSP